MSGFYRSLKPLLNHGVLARPTHWQTIFGNGRPIELEIGFGNGEYLARLAQEQPGTNFIGFEQYCERIHRTLRKLSRVDSSNVRILRLDVRAGLQRYIAPESLRMVYCLYPPPWPKKSDIKHRLLNTHFLKLVNSRLSDGGRMKIVTDYEPYALWIKDEVPGSGFDLEYKIISATYDTKFERKWVEGGQKDFYELLLTKKEHFPVPLKEDVPVQMYKIADFDPEQFTFENFSQEGMAVSFKDILYDPKKMTAIVHVIVVDEHITQNIRIVIYKIGDIWRIHLAEGVLFMPTQGIAKALALVYEAALRTKGSHV